MDIQLISRLQFAFTISFHILFPAFSIGLSIFLSTMEGLWLKTKNPIYLSICKFWIKIFALTFGMGVVSGIVMEFQLGTNWAGFTQAVGGVLGGLFTYEVMTAFFIEAGALGVMIFGWNRVSPKLHYFSTLMVTIGTTLSAYWIMAANTWMQHPVGYKQVNGLYVVTNWFEVIFNSAIYPRFIHMMLASYICAAFVIASVSALYLLRKQHIDFAKKCFSFIWGALVILVPLQIVFGDLSGVEVHENQPIKTAAMEGLWDTTKGAPLVLFAIPDQKQQKNIASIEIPHIASLVNTHNWNGELVGLKSVPPGDQPRVAPVFYTFRIMVGVGFMMLFLAAISYYLRRKNKLFNTPWFLKLSLFSAPLGFMALWCGWITAEMGRQPWIVYGVLRTADAVSKVPLHDTIISFVLIFVVYGIIFGYFYFYFLNSLIKAGPAAVEEVEINRLPFQYMPTSSKES